MQTFSYVAKNAKTGEKVKALVQADSETAAAKLLLKEGLVVTEIKAEGASNSPISFMKSKVKAKDRVLFSRQLSTLINAGLPLMQAIRSVQAQTTSKGLKDIMALVIADIEGGSTFADSLKKHPKVFNQVYTSMVAAGEASGTLDVALDRLAVQQEKEADLNSKIKGAMIYPLVVVGVMILVVGFMIVKVLPQVKTLYEGMPGAELPLVTRILLSISDFIIHRWFIVIGVLVILGFFTTKWARTGPGKLFVDKVKMRAWPIGGLFMKVYMARFTRTGTTLVAAGVPLLQVLDICSRAVNNVHIEAALKRVAEKVQGGKSMADGMDGDPNFLPLVPNMLRIGEQSGNIEQMMDKVADYYEKEVDVEVENISSIIEPVLMIVLGVVAFIIVAAVLLPIYGLAGQSGFGG